MGSKKHETRRGTSLTSHNPLHANEYRPRRRVYSELDESPTVSPVVPPVKKLREEPEDGELSDETEDIVILKEVEAKKYTDVTVVKEVEPVAKAKTTQPRRIREGNFSTAAPSMLPTTPFASNTSLRLPEEAPHRKYIRERNITEIPVYWNENPFTVAKLKETRNAQKCSSCTKVFNKKSTAFYDLHVIIHSERFQFPKSKEETRNSTKERCSYICAKLDCVRRRYPYIVQSLLEFTKSVSYDERQIFFRDFNVRDV